MSNKTMIKNELVYLANERGAKVSVLNRAIKKVNQCETYEEMLSVYREFDQITK